MTAVADHRDMEFDAAAPAGGEQQRRVDLCVEG